MLDPELWLDFVQHRKDKKKPLSPVAEKRMLSRLSRFEEQGQDINNLLEKAIIRGWLDIYPEKLERPMAHKPGVIPETPIIDKEAARAAVQTAMRKLRIVG